MYLLPALIAAIIVPALSYQTYALRGMSYALARDGIRLRCGLRSEDIPMDAVIWVRPASEVGSLPLPYLRWPGSVTGSRHLPENGQIEYMATRSTHLLLIATTGHIFAISPDNPVAFMQNYQRLTELGSLSPLPAHSVYPTFMALRLWNDLPARYLLLGGTALSLALLVLVSLAVPAHAQVSLKLAPDGTPLEPIPSVRLLLLPVLNAIFFITDLILGLFFYRRTVSQPGAWHAEQWLSYLLWSSGVIATLLFLGAVVFILNAA